jgi:hypothetical protein
VHSFETGTPEAKSFIVVAVGLDRLDAELFVLMILSRIIDRRRRRRFAPSLTRSSTRTKSVQAIKAAVRVVADE